MSTSPKSIFETAVATKCQNKSLVSDQKKTQQCGVPCSSVIHKLEIIHGAYTRNVYGDRDARH